MKQFGLTVTALVAATFAAPAAAEEAPDRMALMDWGYTIAGDRDTDAPLASLRDPLCMIVASEDQGFARAIGRRVIANARSAGVPVQRGKCRFNAAIVFADDALAQLKEVREKRGRVYGSLYAAQLTTLLETERDGFAFLLDDIEPFGGPIPAFRSNPQRPDLAGALVVIDRAAAEGLTPEQLADYATLRLLAPTANLARLSERAAGESAPTILTLFRDRAAAPSGMTTFDRAYLESLYALPRGTDAKRVIARASRVAMTDDGGKAGSFDVSK